MRRLSFGDVADDFSNQLAYYQTTLIGLYRQKSSLIAKREALRFQYLTGIKNSLGSVVSNINTEFFNEKNDDAAKLFSIIVNYIFDRLPMVQMNGQPLQGYGQMLGVGGAMNLTYLSPMADFLSKPFDDTSDQTGYQIYAVTGFTSDGWIDMIPEYFFDKPSWPNGVPFTYPPSSAWVEDALYLIMTSTGQNVEGLISQYDNVVQKLEKNYSTGNFDSLLKRAKDMCLEIINQTVIILKLQMLIDSIEAEFAGFVNEYKDQMSLPSFQEILEQLQHESEKSDTAPISDVPAGPTVISTNVSVPLVDANPVLNVGVSSTKSKLPYIAAGIVGLLLLKKGK